MAPCSSNLEEGSFLQASTMALHVPEVDAPEESSTRSLHSLAARSAVLPGSRGSPRQAGRKQLFSSVIKKKANCKDLREHCSPTQRVK